MNKTSPLDWNAYPLNLSNFDSLEVDGGAYQRCLQQDSSRLFDETTRVQALRMTDGARTHKEISSFKELEEYLSQELAQSTSLFFHINPRSSWGRLLISLPSLQKLLSHFAVLPAFLDVLHTFGGKIREKNEDFGICGQHVSTLDAEGLPSPFSDDCRTLEIYYNLKYVEQREGDSRWSMRKMGVYSRTFPLGAKSVWILIHPSSTFKRRFDEMLEQDEQRRASPRRRSDLQIHLLLLQSANQNWIGYINSLEEEFMNLDSKTVMDSFELELEDALRIQRFKEKLLRLSHALDINYVNLTRLKPEFKSLELAPGAPMTPAGNSTQSAIPAMDEIAFDIVRHKTRIENLVRRTDSLGTLIPYILAKRENSLMLSFSLKATQYSRSMKIITILTMVYLPPTFMAGFFGSQFFQLEPNKGNLTMTKDAGYFFAATALLMAVTIGAWLWWERRNRKNGYGDEEMAIVPEK